MVKLEDVCQIDLGASTRSGAVPSLRSGDVPDLQIPLPPLAEQNPFVAEVEAHTTAIDHLEAELERQITRSNRLRQSTLASAFSGRFSYAKPLQNIRTMDVGQIMFTLDRSPHPITRHGIP